MTALESHPLPDPYYFDPGWEREELEAALADPRISDLYRQAFVADVPLYLKSIAAAELVSKGILGSKRDDMIAAAEATEAARRAAAEASASKSRSKANAGDRVGGKRPLSQGLPKPVESSPVAIKASDVEPEEIEWLWPGRLVSGSINNLMGYMGQGKSTLLCVLAAIVTRGRPWPDRRGAHAVAPGNVLHIGTEENRAQVFRPRLDRFGADCDRVIFLPGVHRGSDLVQAWQLSRDAGAIEKAILAYAPVKLLVIDPIEEFMGEGSTYSAVDVRSTLGVLKNVAEKHRVTVLCVHHCSKNSDRRMMNRGMGSAAFNQLARTVWYLVRDPLDKTRNLLTHVKSNVEGVVKTGLAIGLDANDCPVWDCKPIEMDADEVDALEKKTQAEAATNARGPQPTETVRAEAVIRQLLADGKPMAMSALIRAGEQKGVKDGVARKALGRLVKGFAGEPPEVEKFRPEEGGRYMLRLLPEGGKAPPAAPEPAARDAWIRAALGLGGGTLAPRLTYVRPTPRNADWVWAWTPETGAHG